MRFALGLLAAVLATADANSCSRSNPCETDACCSQWGNCGYGPDFCGSGCQSKCDAKPECGKWATNFDCPLKVCCSKWGFCGTTEEFCNAECQGNCNEPPKPSCGGSAPSPQLNIGYYASWASTRRCDQYTIDHIDPKIYTHLNYAFVDVKNGVIAPFSPEESENLHKFADLKAPDLNPDLRVLISVGGWAFNDPGPSQQEFHQLSKTRDSRRRFIQSVKQFLQEYDFDGIDIDWEYPVADDRGGHPEDRENYLSLVREMRQEFGSRYLITIAAPASYWYLRHFSISEMAKSLDWVNVMTYDIHGVWDKDIESLGPYVRPHTDLTEIEPAIGLFVKDGVPYEKLVLGLGYYGRSFTLKDPSCSDVLCEFTEGGRAGECTDAPGTLAWFEIEELRERYKGKEGFRDIRNTTGQTRILVFDKDQWVGYDDHETLGFKRNWAKQNCMKGTMIWSIDQGPIEDNKITSNYNNNNHHQHYNQVNKNQAKPQKLPPLPQKSNQYGTRFSSGVRHAL